MILLITMLTIKILFTINSVKNYFFHRINIIIIKNYFIDYQIIKIYIFLILKKFLMSKLSNLVYTHSVILVQLSSLIGLISRTIQHN